MRECTDEYLFVSFSGNNPTFQLCALIIEAAMNKVINWVHNISKKFETTKINGTVSNHRSRCDSIAQNKDNDNDNE